MKKNLQTNKTSYKETQNVSRQEKKAQEGLCKINKKGRDQPTSWKDEYVIIQDTNHNYSENNPKLSWNIYLNNKAIHHS